MRNIVITKPERQRVPYASSWQSRMMGSFTKRCWMAMLLVSCCLQPTMGLEVITLDVTRDADILEGRPDENMGGWFSLLVGQGDFGLWRSIVYFRLNSGVFQSRGISVKNSILQRARLVLSVDHARDRYVSCTTDPPSTISSSVSTTGCATLHVVTQAWGEGKGNFDTVQNGDSSWQYSRFPEEWDTPGGDFQSTPIGRQLPGDYGEDQTVEFDMDVAQLFDVITGDSRYFGFMIRDDNNPGLIDYESRECVGNADHSACRHGVGPKLVLEFDTTSTAATPPPTPSPTPSPTPAPITPPPPTPPPPTPSPTPSPTRAPTPLPTRQPTTPPPTPLPTRAPIIAIVTAPPATPRPTPGPTPQPVTSNPTPSPSLRPTASPSREPTTPSPTASIPVVALPVESPDGEEPARDDDNNDAQSPSPPTPNNDNNSNTPSPVPAPTPAPAPAIPFVTVSSTESESQPPVTMIYSASLQPTPDNNNDNDGDDDNRRPENGNTGAASDGNNNGGDGNENPDDNNNNSGAPSPTGTTRAVCDVFFQTMAIESTSSLLKLDSGDEADVKINLDSAGDGSEVDVEVASKMLSDTSYNATHMAQVFAAEIAELSPNYGVDTTNVDSKVIVLNMTTTTLSSTSDELSPPTEILTITYQICYYYDPTSVMTGAADDVSASEIVSRYPQEYIIYMMLTSNRQGVEDSLRLQGIPIQPGSLSQVSRAQFFNNDDASGLQNTQPSTDNGRLGQRKNKSGIAAAIASVILAVSACCCLGFYFCCFRRRQWEEVPAESSSASNASSLTNPSLIKPPGGGGGGQVVQEITGENSHVETVASYLVMGTNPTGTGSDLEAPVPVSAGETGGGEYSSASGAAAVPPVTSTDVPRPIEATAAAATSSDVPMAIVVPCRDDHNDDDNNTADRLHFKMQGESVMEERTITAPSLSTQQMEELANGFDGGKVQL